MIRAISARIDSTPTLGKNFVNLMAKRLISSAALLFMVLVLAACGSRAPRLEPPRVKLVSLLVQDGTRFNLDLRVSNPAARQMLVDRINLTVSIDGQALPALKPDFGGTLPALGEELLTVSGELPAAVVERLTPLTEGSRSQLALTISGEVWHSDGLKFEVDESSWLSATPGRPWQFR